MKKAIPKFAATYVSIIAVTLLVALYAGGLNTSKVYSYSFAFPGYGGYYSQNVKKPTAWMNVTLRWTADTFYVTVKINDDDYNEKDSFAIWLDTNYDGEKGKYYPGPAADKLVVFDIPNGTIYYKILRGIAYPCPEAVPGYELRNDSECVFDENGYTYTAHIPLEKIDNAKPPILMGMFFWDADVDIDLIDFRSMVSELSVDWMVEP